MINALSAPNPFGSVKGNGDKICTLSLLLARLLYFHLFHHCLKGIHFLPTKFKGQKPQFLPSNAFKRTLILISVSLITLKDLTRSCFYINLLAFPDLKKNLELYGAFAHCPHTYKENSFSSPDLLFSLRFISKITISLI